MESTCKKEKCTLWGLTDGACPNYIETWWKPGGTDTSGQPKLISDCAPIRTLLMIQELSNRLVGVEKSQEMLTNETVWVQVVAEILGKASGIDLEHFVNERKRLQHIENVKDKLLTR